MKAHAVWRGLAAEPGHDAETDLAVARTFRAIGTLKGEAGETAEGLAMTRESGKLVEEAIAARRPFGRAQSLLGGIHYSIATTLHRTGKLTEAMAAYQQAIEAQRKLSRTDPSNVVNGKTLASLCNCGVLLSQTGRETQAMSSYAEAARSWKTWPHQLPTITIARATWPGSIMPRRYCCSSRASKTKPCARSSDRWRSNSAWPTPTRMLRISKVGWALRCSILASCFRRQASLSRPSRPAGAPGLSFGRLADANPTVPEFQSRLAVIDHNIGMMLEQTGKLDEAMASYRRAVESGGPWSRPTHRSRSIATTSRKRSGRWDCCCRKWANPSTPSRP